MRRICRSLTWHFSAACLTVSKRLPGTAPFLGTRYPDRALTMPMLGWLREFRMVLRAMVAPAAALADHERLGAQADGPEPSASDGRLFGVKRRQFPPQYGEVR